MRVQRTVLLLLLLAPAARAEDPPPRLMGPRLGEERTEALRKNGGNAATEKAVAAGLDWLARHARPDGTWDADGFAARCEEGGESCTGVGKGQHGEEVPCPFDQAISALAVLAFLGHGHHPGAEGDPYAELIGKALRRLDPPRTVWSLALVTQALSEAAVLTGEDRWRTAAHRHAESLLGRRESDGAWGYFAGYGRGSDVPFTALAVQALVAARDAGFELPEDLPAGVDRFLASLEAKEGKLAYVLPGRKFGYTPTTSNAHCAVAIRELLDVGLDGSRHKAHRALVQKRKPIWKISFREVEVPGRGKVPVQIGNLSLYQWWYGTIGMFHHGGSGWRSWFGKLKSALTGNQVGSGCARGSWNPLGTYERQTGGRVFATALAVLMLEQPYRHRRR